MPTTIELDQRGDDVAVLRLDRPERLNAIDEVMVGELHAACDDLAASASARAVVLTGAGRGFCSGIDLRDFGPAIPADDAPAIDRLRFQEMMAALPGTLRKLPQPVIAAVNGPAVGGGLALCLAADIRLCSTSASFGNAAIKLGLSGAEMGMSYYLPRLVGASVAADWMLTGRTVTADEAYRTGLVSAVHEDGELMHHALELAGQIASHSALGVQMTKRALQTNIDAPHLDAALEVENRNQVITHTTDEAATARAGWPRG